MNENNKCKNPAVEINKEWVKFFDEHNTIAKKFFSFLAYAIFGFFVAFGIAAGAISILYVIKEFLH